MNYITKGTNRPLNGEWDGLCEHLTARIGERDAVAPYWNGEQDSFGPVTRFGYCTACWLKQIEEENDEQVTCHDCRCDVRKGDTMEWKAYDHYPPQGDVPLTICKTCQSQPKHVSREQRDQAAAEREFDYDQY